MISHHLSVLKRKVYSAWTDIRHGGLLVGHVESENPGAFNIENSGYDVLDQVFAGQVRKGDILADIGCGKGRALNWWSDHHPIDQAFGIELNETIGGKTQHRFRRNRFIKILIGDAVAMIPPMASLFYLFNPFGEEKMRQFADRLLTEPVARNGLPRRIIYYNCTCLSVFDHRFTVTPIAIDGHHASAVIDCV